MSKNLVCLTIDSIDPQLDVFIRKSNYEIIFKGKTPLKVLLERSIDYYDICFTSKTGKISDHRIIIDEKTPDETCIKLKDSIIGKPKRHLQVILNLEIIDELPFEHEGESIDQVQYLIENYGTNIPCMGGSVNHGDGWEIARVRDILVKKID